MYGDYNSSVTGLSPEEEARQRDDFARGALPGLGADAEGRAQERGLISGAIRARLVAAGLVYLTDIILARWTGQLQFGVYVYVWTCLLLLSDLLPLGLAAAAQRFIPEYTQYRMFQHLRGFIFGSRWLVFAFASAAAALAAFTIQANPAWFNRYEIIPLYLACVALPFAALSNMLDGVARVYNFERLAPIPLPLLRPLLFILLVVEAYAFGAPADAVTAMTAAVAAIWAAAIIELLLIDRELVQVIGDGVRVLDVRGWLRVSTPIFLVWGFYTLVTYTDVLLLHALATPEDVAVYYAASKTLTLVALVYVTVDAAIAHRFRDGTLANDPAALARFMRDARQWTFWPSVAGLAIILLLGYPLLWLFGGSFTAGYSIMFILAIGVLARTAIGPAERLLIMLGQERLCGHVYATAFIANAGTCLLLIPRLGAQGAAFGTAAALVTEALLLFVFMRRQLGLPIFGEAFRLPRLEKLTREGE
jgi:O-antigen/teichoic acid export membrane protein